LKGLASIFATTTEICTGRSFMERYRVTFLLRPRPSTPRYRIEGPGARYEPHRLSAIHFRDRSIRQVSCYTLLSGCRLPWPPTCCQNRPTLFMVSDERGLGALTERLVHPTSPGLLTRDGPLGTHVQNRRSTKHPSVIPPVQSLRIGQGTSPPLPLIIRFT